MEGFTAAPFVPAPNCQVTSHGNASRYGLTTAKDSGELGGTLHGGLDDDVAAEGKAQSFFVLIH
jgi:hypothetical protein